MTTEPASGSILQDAIALTSRRGTTCSVELLYEHRPDIAPELREALRADVSSSAIHAALKRRGIDLPESTIQRHRRKACRCQE